MDKSVFASQKISYTVQNGKLIHRLIGKMPQLQQKYGLWIINSSVDFKSAVNSYSTCPIRKFEFYSLSHLIGGSGKLWLADSGETQLNVGDWILICPGDMNRYGGADDQPYIEDAIRFCGPAVDGMREAGVIKSGVIKGTNCRQLLSIHELACDPRESTQINANISLQKLLVDLYNIRERENSAPSAIDQLIKELKQRPDYWWTVAELAEFCQLSTDQLRRNFVRHTGMLPKQYIEELKIRQAAALLLDSSLSVTEVAAKFGYLDPYHFSRRFKQRVGVSPEKYRNAYVLGNNNHAEKLNSD
ncbi:MAG: helix-turn-helix transcriptional regulator [Lentisphaeria bacterium]|nr:helix-turn-helix transcriptional regulator [Lentisphaeria bacterium]MBR7119909.1 helix-turn-helix transcriptional regulator [Lentisphaeria bacterium]